MLSGAKMMLLRLNHPLGLSSVETGHAPNHLNEELHSCTHIQDHSGFITGISFWTLRFKKKLAEKLGTSHYGDDSTGCHIHAKLVIVPVRREDEALPPSSHVENCGKL
jgi:hypothetical protein